MQTHLRWLPKPNLDDDNDEKDDDKYVNDDDNNDDYDDDDDDGSGVSDAHIHGDRDYGDAIEDDDQNWVWMVMMKHIPVLHFPYLWVGLLQKSK